jgi:hypothetical protein
MLFFFILIVLNGCKCFYYYSYFKDKVTIKETFFQLESRINSYPNDETDQLEIAIYYSDSLPNKIVRGSIKIYPTIGGKDTLKFNYAYASHYYYAFYKKWPEKIDISLFFDVDSLGILTHNSIFLKNLIKHKNCEFKFVPH